MKTYAKHIGVGLVFIVLFVYIYIQQKTNDHPVPVEFNTQVLEKGDEAEKHKAKEDWIENMHRTAPGVDWRTMDIETRKYKFKLNKLNQSKSSVISIAGGTLEGSWHEVGSDNLSGRNMIVEYDLVNDSIYCASAGGNVWKADAAGNGWRSLHDNYKIDDIRMLKKIDHGTGSRLLLASGQFSAEDFYYSDDDGATWTNSTGLSNVASWGGLVEAVVANDTANTVYVLAGEWDGINWNAVISLYVSTDHATSFSKIKSYDVPTYGDGNKFSLWTDPYGSGMTYLLISDSLFSITGTNMPALVSTISYTAGGNVLLSGHESSGGTYLYVGVYDNNYVDFYQSIDGGVSWIQKGNIPSNPFNQNSFTCSATNPLNLYYGGMECYRSYDGGQSWTKLNDWGEYYANIPTKLHADIPGIDSYKDQSGNEILFVSTDGGCYVSYDSALTVQNISLSEHNISQYYSTYTHRTNTNYIFLGSQDQGYQLSDYVDTSTTVSFTQILSGDYGHVVSSNGGDGVWMVYPGFAAYYPNAIVNQTTSTWWNFVGSGQFWMPPLMADPTYPNRVYLGGGSTTTGAHIFHIEYNNGTMTHTELPFDFGGTNNSPIAAMAYSPVDDNYRYVINDAGEFFVSTDGGVSWIQTSSFNGPGGSFLYGSTIVPSPTTLGKVYIGGSGYSNPPAFVSMDNGLSFAAIDSGIPNTLIYEMVADPDDKFVYAATEVGPYVLDVDNSVWYDLSQGHAPDQTYWTVDYIPSIKTARFGTYGRGIWDFRIYENITVKATIDNLQAGLEIWPNPASEFINIKTAGIENITVVSANGQIIKDIGILDDKLNVKALSNGIYFLSAEMQGRKVNRKFIVHHD